MRKARKSRRRFPVFRLSAAPGKVTGVPASLRRRDCGSADTGVPQKSAPVSGMIWKMCIRDRAGAGRRCGGLCQPLRLGGQDGGRDVCAAVPAPAAVLLSLIHIFSIALILFLFIMLINILLNVLLKKNTKGGR